MNCDNLKIGIFGGTFDPIHFGHINIAKAALDEFSLDEVWFMPAGDPYFKKGSSVSRAALRLKMVKACLDELDCHQFVCSDFEAFNKEPTYTAKTLERLRLLYPRNKFYFILGLDALKTLKYWYKPEKIFENSCLLCASRATKDINYNSTRKVIEYYKENFTSVKPDIRLIHVGEMDISSTKLRKMVKNAEDISAYVTKNVYEIIKENKLYL